MIINEEARVFGELDKETQAKLRECETVWTLDHSGKWYVSLNTEFLLYPTYKGELKEKKTRLMTPYELLGRTLMTEDGIVEMVASINEAGLIVFRIMPDDKVDDLHLNGVRLVPEGMTDYDYDKCLPLTVETER